MIFDVQSYLGITHRYALETTYKSIVLIYCWCEKLVRMIDICLLADPISPCQSVEGVTSHG